MFVRFSLPKATLMMMMVLVGISESLPQVPQQSLFQDSVSGFDQRSDLPPRCNPACPRIYLPVCGSDGKTYANNCILDYNQCAFGNVTFAYFGECDPATFHTPRTPCPSSCSGEYDPVCGSDGNTYGSQCVLDQISCNEPSLFVIRNSECGAPFNSCPDVCSDAVNQVCGNDGVTYLNECVYRATVCMEQISSSPSFSSTVGECASTNPQQEDCPVLCPAFYQPVCGTDGRTYTNQCVLDSEKCHIPGLETAAPGECDAATNPPTTIPPQTTITTTPTTTTTTTPPPFSFTLMPPRLFCPDTCTRVFMPVCGSDRRTYYNRCVLLFTACRDRRLLYTVHNGRCVQ